VDFEKLELFILDLDSDLMKKMILIYESRDVEEFNKFFECFSDEDLKNQLIKAMK
jgi:hypothetical protein